MPIGALSRLTTALDKLAKRNALATPNKRKMELYLTEFGYLTQGKRAQKPKVRAKWLHDAFHVARRNPRVRQLLQYQLVDPPSDEIWHSAILDRNGRPLGDLRGPRQGLRRQPLRRLAGQQPAAVRTAAQAALARQHAERGRHRRPAGADQLAEPLVRERQRDDDAVGRDAAEARREVPQQRVQAPLDAGQLRDRLRDREPVGALVGAVQQHRGELRPARQQLRHALVEHRGQHA